LLITSEFAFILRVSGSSAICVKRPLVASNSAWYFTVDCVLLFSASLLFSGVSATTVAFAFGTCAPQYGSLSKPL